jgi:hypothetical protein
MDYESDTYECDLWQGIIVLTHKESGLCGTIHLTMPKRRMNGAQMLKQDINKYGVAKALDTYAKLVGEWQ